MLIRHGTPLDIPDLLALERQAPAAAHWSREQYQNIFSGEAPSRMLLVLKEDAGIQGFIVSRGLDREWEIENIMVSASVRRLGFGSRLLQDFLAFARAQGAEKIFLEVRESNLAARRLYEKSGFSESGRRPSYYQQPPEDAIVYHLGLT
jgi:ribosomal-protein-alanine N-acetyltransferase